MIIHADASTDVQARLSDRSFLSKKSNGVMVCRGLGLKEDESNG